MLGRIVRWLLLLLEYEFTIIYKLGRTHVVFDFLSRLLDNLKPLSDVIKLLDRLKCESKVKQRKNKELGTHSLAHNTLGVEGCVGALGWD